MAKHNSMREMGRSDEAMPAVESAWTASSDVPLSSDSLLNLKKYLIKNRDFVGPSGSVGSGLVLLDQVMPGIVRSLTGTHDRERRTLAADTLAVWLSRSTQCAAKNPQFKKTLADVVPADDLFHYVVDYWSDAGPALGSALQDMFRKMIRFLNVVEDDHDTKEKLFEAWTLESLQLPHSMRVLYFLIEQLYKELDEEDFVFVHDPGFIRESLRYIWSNSLTTNIGKSITMLLTNVYHKGSEDEWLARWSQDLVEALQAPLLRSGVETYVLPLLLKISKAATAGFLKQVSALNDTSLLLGCLSVAQKVSALQDPFDGPDAIVPLSKVEDMLLENNDYYRVTALSLLVSTPRLARPIKPYLYPLLESCLDSMYAETNVETRDKVFSLIKNFIARIRDSTYKLQKDLMQKKEKDPIRFESDIKEMRAEIELGKQFLRHLYEYSIFNLKPGSSHQRKAFSFKVLIGMIRAGLDARVSESYHDKFKYVHFPFSIDIYTDDLLRIMIDNIADNYEDNRNCAANILVISPIPVPAATLATATKCAMSMLTDLKGRDVDSGSRFFRFLYQHHEQRGDLASCKHLLNTLKSELEDGLSHAKVDIANACYNYSIHGYFAAFKMILESIDYSAWKSADNKKFITDLIQALLDDSTESWNITKEVLQHDSPEGNLPEELEMNYSPELESKYGKGTQIILSYAWRALKESTGMTDAIIRRAELTDDQIATLGPLIMYQLATVRHRGAFSAVYPTFVSICTRSSKSTPDLNKQWLDKNLLEIQAESNFITRRSAGLPFLITALLTSNPEFIEPTFAKLLAIAKEPASPDQSMQNMNLPQVNAFNCIKAIFIDSALADQSLKYINESTQLALNSFDSPVWAIRNCAVMLFCALENRMFSSKKIRNNTLPSYPSKMFFTKFPSMKETFRENLQAAVQSGLKNSRQVERIFPVLTILGRLDPTPNYTELDSFKPLVLECMRSCQWKVREMAARSLPALLSSPESLAEELAVRLQAVQGTDLNQAHGNLLAAKELASRIDKTDDLKRCVLSKLEDALKMGYAIVKAYLDILNQFQLDTTPVALLKWFKENNSLGKLDGAKELAVAKAAEVLLGADFDVLDDALNSELYEVQLSALNYCNAHELTDGQKRKLVGELWKLVERPGWEHTKSEALALLNKMPPTGSPNMGLLQSDFSNEPLQLGAVQALGPVLGATSQGPASDSFNSWIRKVRALSDDSVEFPQRSAALDALVGYDNASDATVLEVVAGLFQFLSDDDIDLREEASEHLSKQVLHKGSTLVPAVVEGKMVDWFKKYFSVHREAFGLLFDGETFKLFPFSKKFKDLFVEDHLLFSYEKQNMYRDEINWVLHLNEIAEEIGEVGDRYESSVRANSKEIAEWLATERPADGCLGWSLDEEKFEFVYETLRGLLTLKLVGKDVGAAIGAVKSAAAEVELQPSLRDLVAQL